MLLLMLGITLGLITIVAICLAKSQAQQGLIFSRDISDLKFWESFSYLYLPTVISVLYGLLWSWIDLDARRFEPFFQLCHGSAAAVEDALLLEYPFQFLLWIPFRAAKRGHWSVLASSLAFLLVSWFLTPFQAGMFTVEAVRLSEGMTSIHATSYIPLKDQQDLSAISAQ